ncbi:MAG: hypothetical protein V4494_04320 [Chlamydiota bacterium]
MTKGTRKVFFPLLLLMNTQPLLAELKSSVEFRSAAFFHTSERFREIYGTVGASYQLEGSTKLCSHFDGWANVDWFSQHGKSIGLHDPTKISIFNMSLGIKYPYQFHKHFAAYIGIGPSLARVWLTNKSPFGEQNISQWTVGGVLKTGLDCYINKYLFIDIFADYLYQPCNYKTSVDLGGLKLGAGIGSRF